MVMYDSNYKIFWIKQNYRDRKKRSVDARRRSKGLYRWSTEILHYTENTLYDTIIMNTYHHLFTRLTEGTI